MRNENEMRISVRNLPTTIDIYNSGYEFVVVRDCDGVYWYYGFYNDLQKAIDTANEIGNGIVVQPYQIVREDHLFTNL